MGCREGDNVPSNQSEQVDQASTGSGWLVRTFELCNGMILIEIRAIHGGRKDQVRINKSELRLSSTNQIRVYKQPFFLSLNSVGANPGNFLNAALKSLGTERPPTQYVSVIAPAGDKTNQAAEAA